MDKSNDQIIQELLDEKNRLEAIIASMGDAVSIQDINFTVLYQNQAHKKLIGDHTGEYCYEAYEQRENVCEGCPIDMSFNDGGIHSAVRSSITDRGPMCVEITASPLRNTAGKITGGIEIVRDVTERKRIEGDLHLYREIVSHMAEGVYLIRASDGVIIYANAKFEKMFGYSPSELTGKHVSVVNAPADKSPKEIADEIINALNENGVWTGEIKNIKKDGTPFWCYSTVSTFEHHAHGTLWIAIHQDITDRREAEQELNESNQMLDDITQGITESILLLSKDHKILWANKAALQQTGLPMDKLIGNYCYKATHHTDTPCKAPNDPCPVYELQKTGNPTLTEHIHYDRDGNRISVEVNAYPIKNEMGEVIRFVHVSKDITERKNLEQEREKLILELQAALVKVKTLSGLLPICASCKKIKDDQGYWKQIESYIREHSEAEFTHGVCPECAKKLYPQYYKEIWASEDKKE